MIRYLLLIVAGVLLLCNLAIFMIFPDLGNPALISTSLVILLTGILSHIATRVNIHHGFKVSIPWVFALFGVFEYALSFLIEESLRGSLVLSGLILLFATEILILIICIAISQHNRSKEESK